MSDVSFLLYSHSEYNDLWPIISDNIYKIPSNYKKYIGVDRTDISGLEGFDGIIPYNSTLTYSEKVISLLERITTRYVVFIHDNDLIMNFDGDAFSLLMSRIQADSIDRCMFGIVNSTSTTSFPQLMQVNHYRCPTFMTPYDVGPSIWKTESFKQALLSVPHATYRDIEDSSIQEFCRNNLRMFAFLSSERAYYVMGRPFPRQFQFLHLCVRGDLFDNKYYMDQEANFLLLKKKYPAITKRPVVDASFLSFNRYPNI
jgi:hypothetical protein